MKYEQIITELKNKIYKPIYFLYGDEPYYIDKITGFIQKNVLPESEKAFNETVVYGRDIDIPALINTAKRFPMMANHQVVIVKEAQGIKSFDDFIHYAENPLKSTILVINYKYKSPDKRKKVFKTIDKTGVLFESKKLYDNEIPKWIKTYITARKRDIAASAEIILAEYLGDDLTKIANEVDKLLITLPEGRNKITAEDIEKNIGISKDYNVFELQKALGNKDILKANRIVNYFGKNQKEHHINAIIPSLFFYFSKLLHYYYLKDKSRKNVAAKLGIRPIFVKEYANAAKKYPVKKLGKVISILREYDVKSKGVGNVSADSGELLKEMTYRILH